MGIMVQLAKMDSSGELTQRKHDSKNRSDVEAGGEFTQLARKENRSQRPQRGLGAILRLDWRAMIEALLEGQANFGAPHGREKWRRTRASTSLGSGFGGDGLTDGLRDGDMGRAKRTERERSW
jgi:hypothetical protein